MGIPEVLILLLGVFVWGTAITNNIDCAKLGAAHCQLVFGCYWNASSEISDPSATYPIYTTGGRCVKDPCLKTIASTDSCGNYESSYGTSYCNSRNIGSGYEHWCSQYNADNYNQEDCSGTAATSCQNDTRTVAATEKLCYVQNTDYCALNAMLNGGSCQSGSLTLLGQKMWLNCKEYDVGGVKTCKQPSGCEAHGIENCTYFPDCMVVDGECIRDTCLSGSYSDSSHSCPDPERCSGHQFKMAWYNLKYQSDALYNTIYTTYERHYTYETYCTNRQYNNNPNTFYGLNIIDENGVGSTGIEDYKGEDGQDRCAVARDFCQFCSKFKDDFSECTGAGGVVKNVDGNNFCTDGRENDSAAFKFRLPSAAVLLMLVVLLVFN